MSWHAVTNCYFGVQTYGNSMQPWEKRFKDLEHLLESCQRSYFDPDLFRRNLNQFLQTSRTVTFIIQKHKSTIPDFDNWYSKFVGNKWKGDEVMRWAIESRNYIVKEGDLEVHSTVSAILIYSYFDENDVTLELESGSFINYGIKKLVRFAQKKLPSGVSDSALVKIERRWVCKTLENWEILHAFSYIYARLFECCEDLARHLGASFEKTISTPNSIEVGREDARQVSYIKVNGLKSYTLGSEQSIIKKGEITIPPQFIDVWEKLKETSGPNLNFEKIFSHYCALAEATFLHFGDHVPMLFVFNSDWMPIGHFGAIMNDQADKFMFWRAMAERVKSIGGKGVIWISEAWIRTGDPKQITAVRNLPIADERLSVIGLDSGGEEKKRNWRIKRESENRKPTLELLTYDPFEFTGGANYLRPIARAMGLPLHTSPSNQNFSDKE